MSTPIKKLPTPLPRGSEQIVKQLVKIIRCTFIQKDILARAPWAPLAPRAWPARGQLEADFFDFVYLKES